MKRYKVHIMETLERTFEVEAETPGEAEAIISRKYHDEEIVLNAEDFTNVTIFATRERNLS